MRIFFSVGEPSGDLHGANLIRALQARRPDVECVGYGGPFYNFQETGPMARRVEDLILLMPLLSGPDNWDAAMAPVPLGDPAKVDLKKLRVAYYTTDGENNPSPEIQELVKQCAGYFKDLGCRVTEDKPPKIKELGEARQKFSGANDADHMRRLLAKHGTTQASPGLRTSGNLLPSADFTKWVEVMDSIKSEQLAWFEKYDLIVCPANAKPPQKVPPEFVRTPGSGGGNYTSQYNTTGWPAGVVRAGTSKEEAGLPLGIQLVGQPWRDDVVLAAMAHVEKQTGGWQMPPI